MKRECQSFEGSDAWRRIRARAKKLINKSLTCSISHPHMGKPFQILEYSDGTRSNTFHCLYQWHNLDITANARLPKNMPKPSVLKVPIDCRKPTIEMGAKEVASTLLS